MTQVATQGDFSTQRKSNMAHLRWFLGWTWSFQLWVLYLWHGRERLLLHGLQTDVNISSSLKTNNSEAVQILSTHQARTTKTQAARDWKRPMECSIQVLFAFLSWRRNQVPTQISPLNVFLGGRKLAVVSAKCQPGAFYFSAKKEVLTIENSRSRRREREIRHWAYFRSKSQFQNVIKCWQTIKCNNELNKISHHKGRKI